MALFSLGHTGDLARLRGVGLERAQYRDDFAEHLSVIAENGLEIRVAGE